MQMRNTIRFSQGVTLIELLVALSVLSILLSVGVPSFSQFSINAELTNNANAIFSHLALARSEAIKRDGRVVLCKSADGLTCAGSGSWSQGWLVFSDTNNDVTVDSDEQIITTMPALPAGYDFSGNSNLDSYISFDAQGAAKLTSGAIQAGTLTLCPPTPAVEGNGRQVVLSGSGRSRIVKSSDCS